MARTKSSAIRTQLARAYRVASAGRKSVAAVKIPPGAMWPSGFAPTPRPVVWPESVPMDDVKDDAIAAMPRILAEFAPFTPFRESGFELSDVEYIGCGVEGHVFGIGDVAVKISEDYLTIQRNVDFLNRTQASEHTPTVYAYNTEEYPYYVAMERIQGQVPLHRYNRGNKWDVRNAVIEALATIFTRPGDLWSDLHEENILVDEKGKVWFVDLNTNENFGISSPNEYAVKCGWMRLLRRK